MQQRLLDILLNEDMLTVNQEYSTAHRFAGDRIWTAAVGREVWAKPLPGGRVGVVLFNRNGTTSRCDVHAPPYSGSLEAPCDDNATEAAGAQSLVLSFDTLPMEWLIPGGDEQLHSGGVGSGGSGVVVAHAAAEEETGEDAALWSRYEIIRSSIASQLLSGMSQVSSDTCAERDDLLHQLSDVIKLN